MGLKLLEKMFIIRILAYEIIDMMLTLKWGCWGWNGKQMHCQWSFRYTLWKLLKMTINIWPRDRIWLFNKHPTVTATLTPTPYTHKTCLDVLLVQNRAVVESIVFIPPITYRSLRHIPMALRSSVWPVWPTLKTKSCHTGNFVVTVVITTTSGAASDDKVGIVTTVGFHQ